MGVLVVGSCLIDLFAKVDDVKKFTKIDKKISFNLGDKVPIDIYNLSLGGNAANVTSGLKSLGHDVALYTYLGNDTLSKHIENSLQDKHVELIVERGDMESSSLSFILNFEQDRIIFSHHNKKNHGFDTKSITANPDYIFLTSMGDFWEDAYEKVLNYSRTNNIPIAFSPGSHQLQDMNEVFSEILRNSEILMCNVSEASEIARKHSIQTVDIRQMLTSLKSLGPQILSITDGARGAYALDKDNIYHIDPIRSDSKEKTGAGDAYAAGFLSAILKGKEVQDATRWGNVAAFSVMQEVGAQKGLVSETKADELVNKYLDIKAILL